MDKIKLFISYSSSDDDKVAVIKRLLENHELISPIIIAAKRESQKPLASKVAEQRNWDYLS
jgi:hypothetical protein